MTSLLPFAARTKTWWSEKERKVGIWVNSESARYKNVPAYYASASNRPMDIIASPEVLLDYRIGLQNQRFIGESKLSDDDQKVYREALVRNMQGAGLFGERPAKISFLSNQLFRTDIHFPANTPTGTYTINVYLIRDGRVASVKTTPLVVSKLASVPRFMNSPIATRPFMALLP